MKRPKISVYIAMSIDGYIARKNGALDWLDSMHQDGEDYGYRDFMDSVDVLLLGKNTYESVSSFDKWPYQNKRVIVLSSSLKKVREEAELYSGELDQLASSLHQEGVKHVYIDGGVTISNFLDSGLVDRMILSVIPTILGSGIPLFSPLKQERTCRLVSSKAFPTGLIQLNYAFNS